MDDQTFTGKCPTCGQPYCAAEIERLTVAFKRECDLTVDLREEIERLKAALNAQQAASEALEDRAGYEQYQALQNKADELRRAALAS